jgi:hypothetical protein
LARRLRHREIAALVLGAATPGRFLGLKEVAELEPLHATHADLARHGLNLREIAFAGRAARFPLVSR